MQVGNISLQRRLDLVLSCAACVSKLCRITAAKGDDVTKDVLCNPLVPPNTCNPSFTSPLEAVLFLATTASTPRFYRNMGNPAKWPCIHLGPARCLMRPLYAAIYFSNSQMLSTLLRYRCEARRGDACRCEEPHHVHPLLRVHKTLYLFIEEPDLAIAMYKKWRQYDNMMRVVKEFHPDLLSDTHMHLAKELESEGNYVQAEAHFLAASDWKAAVNMYRANDMWEEAYAVAKKHGGPVACKQVAYLWAKSLGGDSAVRLLTKFGLLDSTVDYAAENCAFDFAFELAQAAAKHKLPDIHLKYAIFLEDEGKFHEAELEFIKANKPKEAVLMYVHNQDWDSARRVAEAHDQESVADVSIGQARVAFQAGHFQQAESLALRAERPDLVIKLYKDAGMWNDALRICREYTPSKLIELQEEYDAHMDTKGTGDADALLEQAQEWERNSEYERAVECYMRMTPESVTNVDARLTLVSYYLQAADLALKFLGEQKADRVLKNAARMLLDIQKHSSAAQLFLSMDMVKEAVEALIAGGEWTKAKKVAQEFDTRLEEQVDKEYKSFLRSRGQTDQLANVDIIAALDLYAEKQQWKKCLETAEQQGPQVLHKYVALCASEKIREGSPLDALRLYADYGAPALPQNFNIYRHIVASVFALPGLYGVQAYRPWSELRDVLHDLVSTPGPRATSLWHCAV
ncbi:hypothetical protein HPB48_007918 [Haemaphysalis longicornis]|uniref:IF140/IFT172/WDR19 TPR domain-containing protein n=1 Tax=Haemaphysalis longicornis TaxID=44386 RepID=A0A9J6G865_HAELO|nr:hypothetical protein HPB48_007918 [Haemaphysalis longicornis]